MKILQAKIKLTKVGKDLGFPAELWQEVLIANGFNYI
jgi:hypothetical protein